MAHYRRGAWYFMPLGRFEETLAEARQATRLDPLSPLHRSVEVLSLDMAGHNEEAIERGRTLHEMFPPSFFTCLIGGLALGGSGALGEAETALEQGLQLDPNSAWMLAVLAGVLAKERKADRVLALKARIEALEKTQYVVSVVRGLVEAVSGNLDSGFALLEQAAAERLFWTIFLIRSPLFARFLAGPRYDALLRRMNLA